MNTGFWWGNLQERVHLEDLSIDGKTILIWILELRECGGTDCINLTQQVAIGKLFGFHIMWGI
jgi:hypothetical protein